MAKFDQIISITPSTIELGESVTISYYASGNSIPVSDNGNVIFVTEEGEHTYDYTPTTVGQHSISMYLTNTITITVTAPPVTVESSLNNLIDTLESNLQYMGVSDAEFDSTTGIIGLADKILNIETGGSEDNNSSCITFSFDDSSVFCDNIPLDKAYFLEDQNGDTDYMDSEINPTASPHYDDLTIYCCNLSDVEEVMETALGEYNFVSEYYADVPNGLVQLIGTLQYPDGTLTYNCSSGSGSDCSQYQTQINDAITYINGSGS